MASKDTENLARMLGELSGIAAEFAAMQAEHHEGLASGRVLPLTLWTARRQRLRARLAACLDGLDRQAVGRDLRARSVIEKNLTAIMAGEEALAAGVARRQEAIDQQLRMMRKGRAALKGYGAGPRARPHPRYVSSRT